MLELKYQELIQKLSAVIPAARLIHDPLRTLAYGTDASFYRLVPKVVVRVESEPELVAVVRACAALLLPYTFRAAGTSLSGQAVSDSVLIQLSRLWNGIELGPDGMTARLEPAVLGASANAALAPFRRKIGPDPASIDSAMIGGIAANNASGMCCGNVQDTYHTMASLRAVLADGSVLDTASTQSRRDFAGRRPELLNQIRGLARKVRENSVLSDRIRKKYRIKNTTGYSLHSLIDHSDPIDILSHLLIGSEGTLGFISELTYNTVPDPPYHATGLLLFPDIRTACDACFILSEQNVAAVELMDRESLRSVETKPGIPAYFRTLDESVASLLVEITADSLADARDHVAQIAGVLSATPPLTPAVFTHDKVESKQLWNIRKGLFPSLGHSRATGTTIIIEDIAVPTARLAETSIDLRNMLGKYAYQNAVIFGHALQGNLHFVFCQDFNRNEEVRRYEEFLDEVAGLITGKYDGSLKAEHGTGRNMAPFVEREWGADAFAIMREIKQIFDPQSLMNPGVIINSDPRAHVKDLKLTPASNPIIEKCTECGFCERTCPSRHLTLTPRQRIVAYREISRLKASGEDPQRLADLQKSYQYQGEETCAVDGLCATLCPLDIDTGKFIKQYRSDHNSPMSRFVADKIANNIGSVARLAGVLLRSANLAHSLLRTPGMTRLTSTMRSLSGNRIPQWNPWLPKPSNRPPHHAHSETLEKVIYFPSCVSRIFGASAHGAYADSQNVRLEKLFRKAGFEPVYPEGVSNLCCGMAFSSKGFGREGDGKLHELAQVLMHVSENGKLPVVFDTSPCAYRTRETSAIPTHLRIYDVTEFILERIAPRLHLRKLPRTVAVHVPCSLRKMDGQTKLVQLASLCAERVRVPDSTPCCGFAGDRGFSHPELTASALISLKGAIGSDCQEGYSTSRMCEVGCSEYSGISYQSIAYLVDEASEVGPDLTESVGALEHTVSVK